MAWYNTSWRYRVKVTAQNGKVDADINGFPIYLDLSLLPAGFHTNCNQTDARDIRITKADGTTEVPREIVYYTAASDTGEVHFKGDILNASDVDFYVYYGNPAASDYATNATYGAQNVWDANYLLVHHYGNGSSLSYADSTSNANNGVNANGTPTAGAGQVGGAIALAKASSQYYEITDKAQFRSLQNLTIEAWANLTSTDTDGFWIFGKNVDNVTPTDPYEEYAMFGDTTRNIIFRTASSPTTGWTDCTQAAAYMPLTAWTHLVATYDHATMRQYKNGTVSGTTTAVVRATGTSTSNPHVGTFITSGFNYDFDGKIDELRFSNIARAATWLSTQYNNQSSASTFFAIGAVENGGNPPYPNNFQYIQVGNGMSTTERVK